MSAESPAAARLALDDAWLRALAEHTSVAIFVFRDCFLYANHATQQITGYGARELQTMRVWDIVHPADRAAARSRLEARLRGEPLQPQTEFRIVTRAGEERWLSLSVAWLEREGVRFGVGTAYDVTERRRAEEALRDNEERLRLAQSASVVWDWNVATDELVVSDFAREFFGVARTPRTASEFFQMVVPEDRPALRAALRRTLKENVDLAVELRFATSAGEVRWAAQRGRAMRDPSGWVRRILGVAHDITRQKRAEEALRDSEAKYRVLVESQTDLVVKLDTAGRLTFLSPSVASFLRADTGRLLGRRVADVVAEEERPAVRRAARQLVRAPHTAQLEQRVFAGGRWRWIAWAAKGVLATDRRRLTEIVAVGRDVTDRKLGEEALFQEKERAQVTLAAIGDGVIRTDEEGRIDYLNPAAEQMTGWKSFEAKGRRLAEVFTAVDSTSRQPIADPVARCLSEEGPGAASGQAVLLRSDGQEFWVHHTAAPVRSRAGRGVGAVLVFKDTTALRGMEREVAYLAAYDPLTGLLNRREFERRLERALLSARDQGRPHALCYLDLDEFKVVNEVCGHGAGDELLKHVADLLQRRSPEGVTLARLGGDEFGVLIEDRPLKEARRIAQEVRRAIAGSRFTWQDRTFEPAVSIGLVPIGPETGDLAALMIAADAACYAAKESGRNLVHEYQPDDAVLAERSGEMHWIARIHKAFEQGRFVLYHQPIEPLGADGGEVLSEVVLRMLDEQGSVITPNAFIPAAERYHLVPAIDRWVVRQALHALGQAADGGRSFTINLSGQSLSEESFLEFVVQNLMSSRAPTERVLFEITETAAIANHARALNFISILRGMGCRFVLDDFGTGFSTFAYLKNLPVNFLKIDGEFVRDLPANPIHQVLVESIHHIGHAMGIQTIAEAVEDDATLQALRRMGVDYAQGFHIARPQPL